MTSATGRIGGTKLGSTVKDCGDDSDGFAVVGGDVEEEAFSAGLSCSAGEAGSSALTGALSLDIESRNAMSPSGACALEDGDAQGMSFANIEPHLDFLRAAVVRGLGPSLVDFGGRVDVAAVVDSSSLGWAAACAASTVASCD